MNFYDKAKTLQDELVRLRRDIHQHPELGFQEFRTAALVVDTLTEIGGYDIKTEVGRTGVTAQIGNGDGPTIGIRADMDALPIQEAGEGRSYKSTTDGLMHACGHDAHTAMLLGVAQLLRQSMAEEGDQWQGNVRLLFQPSEEKSDENGISGAPAMIHDNAMEGVDAVIAVHVDSTEESGMCYFWDGYALAAADSFEAWIYGAGGHGAYPHRGSDPLFMLSTVMNNIYAIPSRYISPLMTNVISLGVVQAGTADNVIPAEVYVNGTIRSFDEEVRPKLWEEVERAFKLVETLGGSYKFNLREGYPSMFNDARVNSWMRNAARDIIGPEAVEDSPFGMAGEDFSYMTKAAPGAMFSLGAKVENGGPHHTPMFDIDEEILSIGTAVLAETARRFVLGQTD